MLDVERKKSRREELEEWKRKKNQGKGGSRPGKSSGKGSKSFGSTAPAGNAPAGTISKGKSSSKTNRSTTSKDLTGSSRVELKKSVVPVVDGFSAGARRSSRVGLNASNNSLNASVNLNLSANLNGSLNESGSIHRNPVSVNDCKHGVSNEKTANTNKAPASRGIDTTPVLTTSAGSGLRKAGRVLTRDPPQKGVKSTTPRGEKIEACTHRSGFVGGAGRVPQENIASRAENISSPVAETAGSKGISNTAGSNGTLLATASISKEQLRSNVEKLKSVVKLEMPIVGSSASSSSTSKPTSSRTNPSKAVENPRRDSSIPNRTTFQPPPRGRSLEDSIRANGITKDTSRSSITNSGTNIQRRPSPMGNRAPSPLGNRRQNSLESIRRQSSVDNRRQSSLDSRPRWGASSAMKSSLGNTSFTSTANRGSNPLNATTKLPKRKASPGPLSRVGSVGPKIDRGIPNQTIGMKGSKLFEEPNLEKEKNSSNVTSQSSASESFRDKPVRLLPNDKKDSESAKQEQQSADSNPNQDNRADGVSKQSSADSSVPSDGKRDSMQSDGKQEPSSSGTKLLLESKDTLERKKKRRHVKDSSKEERHSILADQGSDRKSCLVVTSSQATSLTTGTKLTLKSPLVDDKLSSKSPISKKKDTTLLQKKKDTTLLQRSTSLWKEAKSLAQEYNASERDQIEDAYRLVKLHTKLEQSVAILRCLRNTTDDAIFELKNMLKDLSKDKLFTSIDGLRNFVNRVERTVEDMETEADTIKWEKVLKDLGEAPVRLSLLGNSEDRDLARRTSPSRNQSRSCSKDSVKHSVNSKDGGVNSHNDGAKGLDLKEDDSKKPSKNEKLKKNSSSDKSKKESPIKDESIPVEERSNWSVEKKVADFSSGGKRIKLLVEPRSSSVKNEKTPGSVFGASRSEDRNLVIDCCSLSRSSEKQKSSEKQFKVEKNEVEKKDENDFKPSVAAANGNKIGNVPPLDGNVPPFNAALLQPLLHPTDSQSSGAGVQPISSQTLCNWDENTCDFVINRMLFEHTHIPLDVSKDNNLLNKSRSPHTSPVFGSGLKNEVSVGSQSVVLSDAVSKGGDVNLIPPRTSQNSDVGLNQPLMGLSPHSKIPRADGKYSPTGKSPNERFVDDIYHRFSRPVIGTPVTPIVHTPRIVEAVVSDEEVDRRDEMLQELRRNDAKTRERDTTSLSTKGGDNEIEGGNQDRSQKPDRPDRVQKLDRPNAPYLQKPSFHDNIETTADLARALMQSRNQGLDLTDINPTDISAAESAASSAIRINTEFGPSVSSAIDMWNHRTDGVGNGLKSRSDKIPTVADMKSTSLWINMKNEKRTPMLHSVGEDGRKESPAFGSGGGSGGANQNGSGGKISSGKNGKRSSIGSAGNFSNGSADSFSFGGVQREKRKEIYQSHESPEKAFQGGIIINEKLLGSGKKGEEPELTFSAKKRQEEAKFQLFTERNTRTNSSPRRDVEDLNKNPIGRESHKLTTPLHTRERFPTTEADSRLESVSHRDNAVIKQDNNVTDQDDELFGGLSPILRDKHSPDEPIMSPELIRSEIREVPKRGILKQGIPKKFDQVNGREELDEDQFQSCDKRDNYNSDRDRDGREGRREDDDRDRDYCRDSSDRDYRPDSSQKRRESGLQDTCRNSGLKDSGQQEYYICEKTGIRKPIIKDPNVNANISTQKRSTQTQHSSYRRISPSPPILKKSSTRLTSNDRGDRFTSARNSLNKSNENNREETERSSNAGHTPAPRSSTAGATPYVAMIGAQTPGSGLSNSSPLNTAVCMDTTAKKAMLKSGAKSILKSDAKSILKSDYESVNKSEFEDYEEVQRRLTPKKMTPRKLTIGTILRNNDENRNDENIRRNDENIQRNDDNYRRSNDENIQRDGENYGRWIGANNLGNAAFVNAKREDSKKVPNGTLSNGINTSLSNGIGLSNGINYPIGNSTQKKSILRNSISNGVNLVKR